MKAVDWTKRSDANRNNSLTLLANLRLLFLTPALALGCDLRGENILK